MSFHCLREVSRVLSNEYESEEEQRCRVWESKRGGIVLEVRDWVISNRLISALQREREDGRSDFQIQK